MPESQKKELFSAGITYMVSGEYAFAFSCFTQVGKSDLPTLYNKALCCYYLSLYNDCRSLLLEAERSRNFNREFNASGVAFSA